MRDLKHVCEYSKILLKVPMLCCSTFASDEIEHKLIKSIFGWSGFLK